MSREISQDGRDLFRLVAENVRDFAVFATDAEGRIVSWNPGVERLLGYAEDEWVGRHASVIFTREQVLGRLFRETPWWEGLPEVQAGWPARPESAARSDGPVFSEDLYRAADGTRVAEASVTAVKDAEGRVEFIVQASDITERQRFEEERE